MQNSLVVSLDRPGVDEAGVPADDFSRVLEGVGSAVRLMVMHLGGREPGPGQPPAWVRDQSRLLLVSTRPGSIVAELALESPPDTQMPVDNYGEQAIASLRDWDGDEDSTLPPAVADCLHSTASDLSKDTQLFFGTAVEPRRVEVKRGRVSDHNPAEVEDALLEGWLREVNWDKGTAQLHDSGGDYVRLRFDSTLGEEMRRLTTRHVKVRGSGSFNKKGEWRTVDVQEIIETRSSFDSLDINTFLNDSEVEPFDPDAVVTIDLTEDEWESFNQAIREGRQAG